MRSSLSGAIAGLIATVPMTATMLVMQRLLPRRQQTRLEPRRISDQLLAKAGLSDIGDPPTRKGIAVASHFGYGTAVGMAYPLVESSIPGPKCTRGAAFGLSVWAASYLGWLPAADILPRAQDRSLDRNVLLIASHLVWGASLQGILHAERKVYDENTGPNKLNRQGFQI